MALTSISVMLFLNIWNDSPHSVSIQNLLPSFQFVVVSGLVLYESLHAKPNHPRPLRLLHVVANAIFAIAATHICLCLPAVWNADIPYMVDAQQQPLFFTAALCLTVGGIFTSWTLQRRERQKTDIVPALATFFGFWMLSLLAICNLPLQTHPPVYVSWIAAAVFTAIAAAVLGRKLPGFTGMRASWIIAGICLILTSHDNYHVAHFTGVLALALNILQYMRDKGRSDHDRALITSSCVLVALASTLKIAFSNFSSAAIMAIKPELIAFIPVLSAYAVARFIWKYREPSHGIACAITFVSMLVLYLATTSSLKEAIIVALVSIAFVIISLRTKLYRYLGTGLTIITLVVLFETFEFWSSFSWWVYLLAIGLTLIAIAVANELMRRTGKRFKERTRKLFQEWKW